MISCTSETTQPNKEQRVGEGRTKMALVGFFNPDHFADLIYRANLQNQFLVFEVAEHLVSQACLLLSSSDNFQLFSK